MEGSPGASSFRMTTLDRKEVDTMEAGYASVSDTDSLDSDGKRVSIIELWRRREKRNAARRYAKATANHAKHPPSIITTPATRPEETPSTNADERLNDLQPKNLQTPHNASCKPSSSASVGAATSSPHGKFGVGHTIGSSLASLKQQPLNCPLFLHVNTDGSQEIVSTESGDYIEDEWNRGKETIMVPSPKSRKRQEERNRRASILDVWTQRENAAVSPSPSIRKSPSSVTTNFFESETEEVHEAPTTDLQESCATRTPAYSKNKPQDKIFPSSPTRCSLSVLDRWKKGMIHTDDFSSSQENSPTVRRGKLNAEAHRTSWKNEAMGEPDIEEYSPKGARDMFNKSTASARRNLDLTFSSVKDTKLATSPCPDNIRNAASFEVSTSTQARKKDAVRFGEGRLRNDLHSVGEASTVLQGALGENGCFPHRNSNDSFVPSGHEALKPPQSKFGNKGNIAWRWANQPDQNSDSRWGHSHASCEADAPPQSQSFSARDGLPESHVVDKACKLEGGVGQQHSKHSDTSKSLKVSATGSKPIIQASFQDKVVSNPQEKHLLSGLQCSGEPLRLDYSQETVLSSRSDLSVPIETHTPTRKFSEFLVTSKRHYLDNEVNRTVMQNSPSGVCPIAGQLVSGTVKLNKPIQRHEAETEPNTYEDINGASQDDALRSARQVMERERPAAEVDSQDPKSNSCDQNCSSEVKKTSIEASSHPSAVKGSTGAVRDAKGWRGSQSIVGSDTIVVKNVHSQPMSFWSTSIHKSLPHFSQAQLREAQGANFDRPTYETGRPKPKDSFSPTDSFTSKTGQCLTAAPQHSSGQKPKSRHKLSQEEFKYSNEVDWNLGRKKNFYDHSTDCISTAQACLNDAVPTRGNAPQARRAVNDDDTLCQAASQSGSTVESQRLSSRQSRHAYYLKKSKLRAHRRRVERDGCCRSVTPTAASSPSPVSAPPSPPVLVALKKEADHGGFEACDNELAQISHAKASKAVFNRSFASSVPEAAGAHLQQLSCHFEPTHKVGFQHEQSEAGQSDSLTFFSHAGSAFSGYSSSSRVIPPHRPLNEDELSPEPNNIAKNRDSSEKIFAQDLARRFLKSLQPPPLPLADESSTGSNFSQEHGENRMTQQLLDRSYDCPDSGCTRLASRYNTSSRFLDRDIEAVNSAGAENSTVSSALQSSHANSSDGSETSRSYDSGASDVYTTIDETYNASHRRRGTKGSINIKGALQEDLTQAFQKAYQALSDNVGVSVLALNARQFTTGLDEGVCAASNSFRKLVVTNPTTHGDNGSSSRTPVTRLCEEAIEVEYVSSESRDDSDIAPVVTPRHAESLYSSTTCSRYGKNMLV